MPHTFKLMTFNIAHGRGLSMYQGFNSTRKLHKNLLRISELIMASGADIVALQEVDEDSHWNKNIDLFAGIRDHTDFDHCLLGINNRREGRKQLAYGNAVLSRYPVHDWENNPFGNATLGEKGFLYAEINIGPATVTLVNLHLDFRSKKTRIAQIEKMLDYLQTKHTANDSPFPPIICGDLNSRSESTRDATQHLFRHILDYGDYTLYPQRSRTFPAHFPVKGIDFVFLPKPFRSVDCRVVRTYTSDHRPVLLEFTLDEEHAGLA